MEQDASLQLNELRNTMTRNLKDVLTLFTKTAVRVYNALQSLNQKIVMNTLIM